MDPATMYLLSSLIGGGISALKGGNSGQKMQSFEGTNADPVDFLSQFKSAVGHTLEGAVNRANDPVDLSGAAPMSPGSFSTKYPPRSVGGFASSTGAPARVPFSGFNLPTGDDLFHDTSASGSPHATNRDYMNATHLVPSLQTKFSSKRVPIKGMEQQAAANMPAASTPNGNTTQGQASAQLLLHSLMAQPTDGGQAPHSTFLKGGMR